MQRFHHHKRLALEQAIPDYEFRFFSSIKESGNQNGTPFVQLYNGDRLFGFSDDGGYYEPIFRLHAEDFEKLNITQDCYGAAFDALISYHHENAYPILKTNYLVRGGVVLDVGCRACHFAVKAAPIASKVICLDPTDFAERYFNLHVMGNNLKNCEFIKAAVGSKEGKKTFFSGSSGESFSGLFETTFDADGGTVVAPSMHSKQEEVDVTTIDHLCSKMDRLDLMVLQINGAEFEALQGASSTLQRLRPFIHVTIGQSANPNVIDGDSKIYALLASVGYRRILRSWGADVYCCA